MSDVATTTAQTRGTGAAPPKGLAARALGVIFSPRETYADIAARPAAAGALFLTIVITALVASVFLSTDVGRNASLDQQFSMMERLPFRLSDEQLQRMEDQMEARAKYAPLYAAGGIFVGAPLTAAIAAGLAFMVFNVGLGGEATFKQLFAVVAYSRVISVVQILFVMPLNYARQSMSSATTLMVFFPMLDNSGFFAGVLGWVDLFWIWWIVSLAIGLGVLYKRKTAPIAGMFLALYASFALIAAAVVSALSGA
jgi:hypothetical protein